MTDLYAYWKAALAGEKPKAFVDSPMPGFYRTSIREFLPLKNGQGSAWKHVGWKPVAIFLMSGTDLVVVVGAHTAIDRDEINEIWTYCSGNPITEEEYRSVAERGEGWSDESFKGEK